MSNDLRQQKGHIIASKSNQIKRLNAWNYQVKSQSGNKGYTVSSTKTTWSCTCPDYAYRHLRCKHIWAVKISLQLRERVVKETVIRPLSPNICPFCTSKKVVKHGLRHNKYGQVQRFTCKKCGKRFTLNYGFEKMKSSPQSITSAMQLYFTGESLRNVQKFLRLQEVNVSHVSIYKWIQKYTQLMQKYLSEIEPNVSDIWRADELYLKIKGDMKYLFALMDDETRFWIAQEVADSKYTHDARELFRQGKEITGKKPLTLITDGLQSYHKAYMKEYRTTTYPRTQHIHKITIKGKHNNNKMERFNGEIRDREKVMRGLKKKDTVVLTGYQIYHNYVRPHEALEGKTPAEKCGIKVEGKNKWLTIIQNAVRQ